MNIRINLDTIRPSTIAAMIADSLECSPYNLPTMSSGPHAMAVARPQAIKALIEALETIVGEEESLEYLCDAGITPEQIIEMWETVAP